MAEPARTTRSRPRRRSLNDVLASAISAMGALTGRPVEGVSAVERSDDGWRLHIEVLELERVPDTTSVLATYEVEVDESGELLSYRRMRRYHRASTEDS